MSERERLAVGIVAQLSGEGFMSARLTLAQSMRRTSAAVEGFRNLRGPADCAAPRIKSRQPTAKNEPPRPASERLSASHAQCARRRTGFCKTGFPPIRRRPASWMSAHRRVTRSHGPTSFFPDQPPVDQPGAGPHHGRSLVAGPLAAVAPSAVLVIAVAWLRRRACALAAGVDIGIGAGRGRRGWWRDR